MAAMTVCHASKENMLFQQASQTSDLESLPCASITAIEQIV